MFIVTTLILDFEKQLTSTSDVCIVICISDIWSVPRMGNSARFHPSAQRQPTRGFVRIQRRDNVYNGRSRRSSSRRSPGCDVPHNRGVCYVLYNRYALAGFRAQGIICMFNLSIMTVAIVDLD